MILRAGDNHRRLELGHNKQAAIDSVGEASGMTVQKVATRRKGRRQSRSAKLPSGTKAFANNLRPRRRMAEAGVPFQA